MAKKRRENRTNMDIILLILAKTLDKHGTTLVHITYPPLVFQYPHKPLLTMSLFSDRIHLDRSLSIGIKQGIAVLS